MVDDLLLFMQWIRGYLSSYAILCERLIRKYVFFKKGIKLDYLLFLLQSLIFIRLIDSLLFSDLYKRGAENNVKFINRDVYGYELRNVYKRDTFKSLMVNAKRS